MKLSNRWNRFVYRLWSPVYDGLFDRFFAAPGRRRAMAVLDLEPGERVLLVGIGTGADLPLLPEGAQAIGIDFSPDMLAGSKCVKTRDEPNLLNGAYRIIEIVKR